MMMRMMMLRRIKKDDNLAEDEVKEDDAAEDEVEDDEVEDDNVKRAEDDDVENDFVENDEVEEEEDDDVGDDDVEEEDRSQDLGLGPHFVRACAVELHVNISHEPLYAEVYDKNATPKNEPRTRTHILCELAQSKRMSRFHTGHFMLQKFTGKMPRPRVSTLIKHRPLLLP